MTRAAPVSRIEPRWPIALVLIGVFVLLALLPLRVRVFPIWVSYVVTTTLIVSMAALSVATAKQRWLQIESVVTFGALCLAGFAIADQLKRLLSEMVRRSGQVSGLQLLASSIAIWVTNVLIFSLLYWKIDRGGPEARVNHIDTEPDWIFPLEKTAQIHRLSDHLKVYFPQMLEWFGRLDSELVCSLLDLEKTSRLRSRLKFFLDIPFDRTH